MAAKWFSFVVGIGLLALAYSAYSGITFEGTTVTVITGIGGLIGMKIGLTDTPS